MYVSVEFHHQSSFQFITQYKSILTIVSVTLKIMLRITLVALFSLCQVLALPQIGTECTNGDFQCAAGGIQQCNLGNWITLAICPDGTTCMPNDFECVPNEQFSAVFSATNPTATCPPCPDLLGAPKTVTHTHTNTHTHTHTQTSVFVGTITVTETDTETVTSCPTTTV